MRSAATMRVMTYNILRGGRPIDAGEDRLDPILDLIRASAPDILALQEANGFDDPALAGKLCESLSLPHVALAAGALYSDGERYHVAVFSRYPITRQTRFDACRFESAALAMQLETPLGPMSLCNLHLHSTSETRRLAELGCVLDQLDSAGDGLILGDLNALSRRDVYPDTSGEFERRFEVTDRLSRDWVDLGAPDPGETAWTHPSRLAADHSRKVARRIDYIYATPRLAGQVAGARVIRSPLAHRASDHFPLVVDFADPARAGP